MKIELCYPIFRFLENDDMLYISWSESNITSRAILKDQNYFKRAIVIDASGLKYIVKEAYELKKLGLLDFLRGKGSGIIMEYDYEENPTKISLEDLKKLIIFRFPKSKWFDETWVDIEEFEDDVNQCDTFKQLALLLE